MLFTDVQIHDRLQWRSPRTSGSLPQKWKEWHYRKKKWAFLKYTLNTISILCIGRGFLSPCYVRPQAEPIQTQVRKNSYLRRQKEDSQPLQRVQQHKIWWSVCGSIHLFRQNSMDKSSKKITAWGMMWRQYFLIVLTDLG